MFHKVQFWALFLFLIYINDLSGGPSYTCNIFADDTSSFSITHDKYVSRDKLNTNLKIIDSIRQWETKSYPDTDKQDQEFNFANITNKESSLFIVFNNCKLRLFHRRNTRTYP